MRAIGRLRFEFLAGFGLIALAMWVVIALLVFQAQRQAVETAGAAGRNVAGNGWTRYSRLPLAKPLNFLDRE